MTAITKSMAENEFNRQAGLFLRRVRMMQGLTQKELATRTGITFQQVQNMNRARVAFHCGGCANSQTHWKYR